jgi:hypothetical protein
MNHILHNISLIILSLGIIMMIVYVTRATSDGFQTFEQKILRVEDGIRRRKPTEIDLYDYKVSKDYKNMFSQPSIWLGYQDFDPIDKPQKIYLN